MSKKQRRRGIEIKDALMSAYHGNRLPAARHRRDVPRENHHQLSALQRWENFRVDCSRRLRLTPMTFFTGRDGAAIRLRVGRRQRIYRGRVGLDIVELDDTHDNHCGVLIAAGIGASRLSATETATRSRCGHTRFHDTGTRPSRRRYRQSACWCSTRKRMGKAKRCAGQGCAIA